MAQPLVIIHGWSDDADSFVGLGYRLGRALGRPTEVISLADWVSLDDNVTYSDLALSMERAWSGLPGSRRHRGHDVLVHSTGALVVRDWMTRYYRPSTVPIKRFVHLAPANFGSPLAHQGRSILGRIFKGEGFQTGTQLLKGLELASPYTWALAERDLFPSGSGWYGAGRILASVFVGMHTYPGLKGTFAGNGTDGTVRISTANLRTTRIRLDFTQAEQSLEPEDGPTQIAMLPIDKLNHSSIVRSESTKLLNEMKAALTVDDNAWPSHIEEMDKKHLEVVDIQNRSRDDHRHAYQHTVMRVSDDLGQAVSDYFLGVELKDNDAWLGGIFQGDALESVHVYGDDARHRALYVDVSRWMKEIDKRGESIRIDFSAQPKYVAAGAAPTKRPDYKRALNVGYRAEHIEIPSDKIDKYFRSNQTTLIDVILPRVIDADLFRMDPIDSVADAYPDWREA